MNKIPTKSCAILKKLNKSIPFDIKPNNFGYIKILIDKNLVKHHKSLTLSNLSKNPSSIEYITITTEGIIYLATNRSDNFRLYIPITISIIALIKSFSSEIHQILQYLVKLLMQ